MEILSAGEKIKRTRIYKGLTLKDICGEKISVSKMSCIENNKVEPEDWILEIVVEKLDLEMEYLKHSVRDQIESNIKKFRLSKDSLLLDEVLHNVDYAEKYQYYDLACELFEIIFEYYLNYGMTSEFSSTIPRYYNSCQKSKDDILHTNYYMYIAKYLYSNKEYSQAGSYIAAARKKLEDLKMKESIEYIKATYNQAVIYIESNNLDKAIDVVEDLKDVLRFNNNEFVNAEIYKVLSIMEIYSKGEKIKEYAEKSLNQYGSMIDKRAAAYFDISEALIYNEMETEGVAYLIKALNEYPRNGREQACNFLINGVEMLIKCKQYDEALKYIEEVLDISIEMNLIPGIDKGYYYKSIILENQNNYIMAETYLMLSLDALLKYGSNNEVCKRYKKIGRMYHKMNQIKDSIRYFDLAFKVNKSII